MFTKCGRNSPLDGQLYPGGTPVLQIKPIVSYQWYNAIWKTSWQMLEVRVRKRHATGLHLLPVIRRVLFDDKALLLMSRFVVNRIASPARGQDYQPYITPLNFWKRKAHRTDSITRQVCSREYCCRHHLTSGYLNCEWLRRSQVLGQMTHEWPLLNLTCFYAVGRTGLRTQMTSYHISRFQSLSQLVCVQVCCKSPLIRLHMIVMDNHSAVFPG